MKVYTEEQVDRILFYISPLNENYKKISEVIEVLTPIEMSNGLDILKKLIEDRPAEFSQYNAYFYLFIIDLIKNGKEVPEQTELLKMIREKK